MCLEFQSRIQKFLAAQIEFSKVQNWVSKGGKVGGERRVSTICEEFVKEGFENETVRLVNQKDLWKKKNMNSICYRLCAVEFGFESSVSGLNLIEDEFFLEIWDTSKLMPTDN